MWDVASTSDALGTLYSNAGTILAVVVAAILTGLVALLGLGFGVRHLRKYITGRKF